MQDDIAKGQAMDLKSRMAINWHTLDDVMSFLPKPAKGSAREFEARVREVAITHGCCAQIGSDLHFTEDQVRELVEALKPKPPSTTPPAVSEEDAVGWIVFLTLPSMGAESNVVMVWAPHGGVESRIKSLIEDMAYTVASVGTGSKALFNKWRSILRKQSLGGARYAPCEMAEIMMEQIVAAPEQRADPVEIYDRRNC